MSVRLKHPREHSPVAMVVIFFIGTIALVGTILCYLLISRAMDSNYEINAAVVALIGQQVSITTLALGALGAMLSSTSPKPAPPPTVTDSAGHPSTPVTVMNAPEQPVPTDPQPDAAPPDAMPDPDGADPGSLTPVS